MITPRSGPQVLTTRVACTSALLACLLLTACLGPTDPDPTGLNPFGTLDRIESDGDGVRVQGWAIDPSTTAPVVVSAWRDGKRVDARADLSRPDVAKVHPRFGDRHGFDFRVPSLPPGVHTICVAVDNVGPGEHTRVLGCGDITVGRSPHGRWDVFSAGTDGRVRVGGWARDPDSSTPVKVGVVLDGRKLATLDARLGASIVPTAVGIGAGRGFATDVVVAPGAHQVCIAMGNVGPGVDSWLGCRSINVPTPPPDHRPVASLSAVEPLSASSVKVVGSASDRDTTAPLQVVLTVASRSGTRTLTTSTAGDRSFQFVVDGLAAGSVDLCAVVVDAPGATGGGALTGNLQLPCGSAAMGDVSMGTTGTPASTRTVGPPSGHPLVGMERDGGVSVRLTDGSTLWLFGDTLERDAQANDKYFLNNTAGWAPADQPAVTRDAVVGGRPVQFATPLPAQLPRFGCPQDMPVAAMWPMSAVALPVSGGTQRVVAFFADMCVGGPGRFTQHGTAVVDWTYDPARPPSGTPIVGTVREQFLFDSRQAEWGTAATVVSDGAQDYIYGYDCESPPASSQVQYPDAWGRCTVARVPAATVHQASAWRWWNGSAWVDDRRTAASMAGIPEPTPGVDSKAPVASFNIEWNPTAQQYLMAYNPWPGYTDEVLVRVSSTPVGPWSEPVRIRMPGCSDRIGADSYFCYAAGVHTTLSGGDRVGIGYFDQLVAVAPPRGAYLTGSIPLAIRSTGL